MAESTNALTIRDIDIPFLRVVVVLLASDNNLYLPRSFENV